VCPLFARLDASPASELRKPLQWKLLAARIFDPYRNFTDLTVKRTQTMTYLRPMGYIRNRLLTASVDGAQMAANTYDQYDTELNSQPPLRPAPGITFHDSATRRRSLSGCVPTTAAHLYRPGRQQLRGR